jgi:tetratricopeptide (TPR) repeat protein
MRGYPRPWDLQLFIKVNRFDDVESACMEGMLLNPSNSDAMAAYEMVRAKAFIAAGKPTEALAAAKAYYDLARLKDTADAIDVVSSALLAANPDGNDAARFRAQQLASVDEPTTQPSPDLGKPMLAAVHVDGSPFVKAIDGIRQNNFSALTSKGNLLLAADRTKEARSAFEAAVELAGPPQLPSAIENVARAIRAETEEIGPANAYIEALRQGVR